MAKKGRRRVREDTKTDTLLRFGVSINPRLLRRFDEYIAGKGYVNRSEALRDLIRKNLVEVEWERGDKEPVGTLTIIYNHEVRELSDRLEDFQHDHYDNIVSTMHVHLDKQNLPRSNGHTGHARQDQDSFGSHHRREGGQARQARHDHLGERTRIVPWPKTAVLYGGGIIPP